MRQKNGELFVATPGSGLHLCTDKIVEWLQSTDLRNGVLTVFIRHTSASLLIQENADPDVLADLKSFFKKLVPEDGRLYIHNDEGPDDMPAHIRAALTQTHLSIPFQDGRLVLGTWQGIYIFEHRTAAHRRRIALHAIGE